jgi:hypothetical protein
MSPSHGSLGGLFEQPAGPASSGPLRLCREGQEGRRGDIGASSNISAILDHGSLMCERGIWERKFRHGIRSVSCLAP